MPLASRSVLALLLGASLPGAYLSAQTQVLALGAGNRAAAVGDVDGDGLPDAAIAQFATGPSFPGLLRLCSGRTGAALWSLSGQGFSNFGEVLAAGGDVDLDGCPDVAVGQQPIVVLSGKTGKVIWRLERPGAYALAFAGDIDLDGASDLAAVELGQVVIYSPRKNTTIRTIYIVEASEMRSIAQAGDVDADGFVDLIAGRTNGSQAVVLSGRTGAQLARVGFPTYQFGYFVGTAGDINGDKHADYIVTGITLHTEPALIFSGKDHTILRQVPMGGGAVRGGHDLDGDGFPDYVVANRAYSGKTGALAWLGANIQGFASTGWPILQGDIMGDSLHDGGGQCVLGFSSQGQVAILAGPRPRGTRGAVVRLFEGNSRATLPMPRLDSTVMAPGGADTATYIRAPGHQFAATAIAFQAGTGLPLYVPHAVPLFLQGPIIVPFVTSLDSEGFGRIDWRLPADLGLLRAEFFQQAAVLSQATGAIGTTNLVMTKVGVKEAGPGVARLRTTFEGTASAGDNLRDALGRALLMLNSDGELTGATFSVGKDAGVGPLELRTAPGSPPLGGGLLLGTVPRAPAQADVKVWLPPGSVRVYLLNTDPLQPAMVRWETVVELR